MDKNFIVHHHPGYRDFQFADMNINGNYEGGSFIYTAEGYDDVPEDVTRVRVHPSVGAIRQGAFYRCSQLTAVNLGDGLEYIGEEAFYKCASLREIAIPRAVRAIREGAFSNCSRSAVDHCGSWRGAGGNREESI